MAAARLLLECRLLSAERLARGRFAARVLGRSPSAVMMRLWALLTRFRAPVLRLSARLLRLRVRLLR